MYPKREILFYLELSRKDELGLYKRKKPTEIDTVKMPASSNEKEQEEFNDFSESGSSWTPSDVEQVSSEGEMEEVAKKKPRMSRTYERNNIKPRSKVEPVNVSVPEIKPKTALKDVIKRKSKPDSTKIESRIVRREARALIKHRESVDSGFGDVLQYVQRIKNAVPPEIKSDISLEDISQAGNGEPVNMTLSETLPPSDKSAAEDMEAPNDSFNSSPGSSRSGDNVLITNKYTKINGTPQRSRPPVVVNTPDVLKEVKVNGNDHQDEWVPIGSGKTMIHRDEFRKVNFRTYSLATRTLLFALFPRKVLATHCLTGKSSPAFKNKPAKMCLNPKTVSDIIMEVSSRFNIRESFVRSIITTKCADEAKMYKTRMENQRKKKEGKSLKKEKNDNQENKPPKA